MHRSDALRPSVRDDPVALARRLRRRARVEALEAVAAVVAVVSALALLSGWRLPV